MNSIGKHRIVGSIIYIQTTEVSEKTYQSHAKKHSSAPWRTSSCPQPRECGLSIIAISQLQKDNGEVEQIIVPKYSVGRLVFGMLEPSSSSQALLDRLSSALTTAGFTVGKSVSLTEFCKVSRAFAIPLMIMIVTTTPSGWASRQSMNIFEIPTRQDTTTTTTMTYLPSPLPSHYLLPCSRRSGPSYWATLRSTVSPP